MTQYSHIKFKARTHEQTIATLKGALADLSLSVKESQWHHNRAAMSVRLDVSEFQFGVNGKGATERYALASAYAELFERLQNISIFNTVFRSGKAENTPLRYPDQKEHRYSQEDLERPHLRHLFADSRAKCEFMERGPHVSIPFYNAHKDEVVYFPERVLMDAVGTNGMCAGNSKTEAIIQGMCEIFERHVLREVLVEAEEPPEIPRECVGRSIIDNYVTPMQTLGYQVYLKDCTLGGRFPVAGIFVRQGDLGLFHLGSSPDMRIALERCFTELLQGETAAELERNLQPIIPDRNAQTKTFWRQEFCHAFRDYKSAQTSAMFRNTTEMNREDVFASDDLTSMGTLGRLLQNVKSLGHELLIRDNTFLGFPAFQLFIPGLSEVREVDCDLLKVHERVQKARNTFFALEDAAEEDLVFLVEVIDELASTPTVDKAEVLETLHNLPLRRDSVLFGLDYRWFASVVHFHAGNLQEAKRLLDELVQAMEAASIDIPAFCHCLRDIFRLRLEGVHWDGVNDFTSSRYSEEDLTYSYFPLAEAGNLTQYFGIPKCGTCDECSELDCTSRTLAIHAEQFQARIDANMQQEDIRNLFLEARRNDSVKAWDP